MAQTDRGIVTVHRRADGTAVVEIGSGVKQGRAVGVFARHVGVTSDKLRVDVALKSTGNLSYSEEIVEVFPDDKGTVYIRPLQDVTNL
ncbi:hypothetical protein GCM10009557_09820 [Virgisporangium ochraceum]|jgi:hypothetical protein|uniref:Uncharacterized protein n=1 Tax=Virgisporangium ochraceum TaxID=65505 RepID=A0A8J3ZWJ5_9ACTN|nr:hypothetical protein [Virgisporangium ochraceum]GIJ71369.1 hypothetical protein Voc01_062860 [Virgisporangium ochraceum]